MNVPTTIELQVGEVQTLNLASLGTAGYVWNYTIAGNATVVTVTADRAAPPSSSATPIAGSSPDEVFTIRGQEPGQVTLHLVQCRPWATDQPPIKEHRITVMVAG